MKWVDGKMYLSYRKKISFYYKLSNCRLSVAVKWYKINTMVLMENIRQAISFNTMFSSTITSFISLSYIYFSLSSTDSNPSELDAYYLDIY